jgi:heme oxygenase (mycobilin-producing)
MNKISAEVRVAPAADQSLDGPVTLMNSFAVSPDRDQAFHELWTQTSRYFTAQPGFISLRLHRAVSTDAPYRWVNVANWQSEAHFRAAHGTEEFRRVVTQPGWDEFPSSPMLFQVVTEVS